MASLTGQLVAETYKALLKLIDNDILTASEKQITDGFGGGSNVFIDSQGFLRANKYKVTNGLATQFLKADGSLDANSYLTSITGAQVITALGYTPVPTTRTITINGESHDLSANNSWTVAGTAAIWGNITGILSNQTDLQNALNAKVPYTGATANVDLGENALLAEYLSIDTDTTHVTDVGEIVWNAIDGTFDMGLLNGVVLQAGQELHFYGKATGAIGNGQAVMFAGVEGDHLLMSLADAATINANPQYFIGIATQDFANNEFGYVTVLGKVRGLNTTSYSLGDVLYYNSTSATDGLLTSTMPVAPNAKIEVAAVVRVHATQGILMVRPHIMPKLNQVQDVYIADPANNHGLFYDLANGYWRNTSIASALGYTPQAQLNGTGFVKASGTTISYDNSTYLSASDAASIYQRLDKMVSNLLPSSTEYPNSQAVINALALKADALNPVFTGYMTISGAEPKLYFTDTDQNPDYFIGADAGFFRIYDQTAGATRFVINSSGVTTIAGDLIVGTIAKSGGTASQFLKADGSIDSNSYVTSASLANYLLISTAASTYQRLDKMVSNLLPSSTEYPNSQAVINALALKADAANPVFTGNMTISGAEPKLYFVDTDQNPDYTVFVDSGFFYIYDQTAGATRFSINSSGNISTGVGKSITAGSFVKDGGTASQYLMADGSVSTLSGLVTGTGTINYIPKWTSGNGLGNSIIYEINSKIHIGTTTESSYKLDVNAGAAGGVSVSNSAAVLSLNLNNSTNNAIARFTSTTNAFWDLQANTDGTFQIDRSDITILGFSTNGNVGISTNNPSTYSHGGTNKGLEIINTDTTANAQSHLILSSNATSNLGSIGSITWALPNSAGNKLGALIASNIVINSTTNAYTNLSFYTANGAGPAYAMQITNTGNLLINTQTDSGIKLDVNGTGRFSGQLNANYGYFGNTGAGSWVIYTTNNDQGNARIRMNNSGTGGMTYDLVSGLNGTSNSGWSIYDATNAATRFYINSGGQILIGTTTAQSGTKLQVAGVLDVWSSTNTLLRLTHDGTRGNIETFTGGGYANTAINPNGGNVLIGTTTDSGWKLYVNGGSTDALKLYNSGGVQSMNIENTTNNTIMRIVSSTNTFWDIQANTDGSFHIDRGDVVAVSFNTSRAATFSSSVTATSFFESSDIRFKKLIESNPIINGIEKLEAKLYEKNGKVELGYFAQDAEKIMPYAVTKNDEGFFNLSYREIHTAKIARLEKEVAELKAQLNLN